MSIETLFSSVFRDAGLQAEFERRGYVVVDDFLDAHSVESLRGVFSLEKHGQAPAFSRTPLSRNLAYRREVHDAIFAAFHRRSDDLLADFALYLGAFVAKSPSPSGSGALPIHQYPSFTNDLEWPTLRIWVPLCDLTEENGALWVVPGTQQLNRFPRGFATDFPYTDLEPHIRRLAKPLYLHAGQAVLAPTTLFHFSESNSSRSLRLAAAMIALPKAAPLWFVYNDPRDSEAFGVYAVDGEFYVTHDLLARPTRTPDLRCKKLCEPIDEHRLTNAVGAAVGVG